MPRWSTSILGLTADSRNGSTGKRPTPLTPQCENRKNSTEIQGHKIRGPAPYHARAWHPQKGKNQGRDGKIRQSRRRDFSCRVRRENGPLARRKRHLYQAGRTLLPGYDFAERQKHKQSQNQVQRNKKNRNPSLNGGDSLIGFALPLLGQFPFVLEHSGW